MSNPAKNNTLVILLISIIVILLLCFCITLPAGFFLFYKAKSPVIDYKPQIEDIVSELPTPIQEDFCDFPNGDVEDWWYTVNPKMQDCYVELNGLPLFLDDVAVASQTPMQYVRDYIISDLESQYTDFSLDEEIETDERIEITFTYENQTQTIWIVKSIEDETNAEVIVGYPNAGGIVYKLEKYDGLWELIEIIDEGF